MYFELWIGTKPHIVFTYIACLSNFNKWMLNTNFQFTDCLHLKEIHLMRSVFGYNVERWMLNIIIIIYMRNTTKLIAHIQ